MNNISIYEQVFALPEVMSNIFSFVSKDIQGIVSKSLVNKEWNSQYKAFLHREWIVIKTVIKNYPQLQFLMSGLDDKSPFLRFKILSSLLEIKNTNFIDIELNAKSFKEVFDRKQNDIALQTIWKIDLRNQLKLLKVKNSPKLNAPAHIIREFLQECEQTTKIKILNLSNCNLDIIPIELNLLRGLERLDLSSNHISTIENLSNLRRLKLLNLGGNNISKIENLDNLGGLQGLILSYNNISTIENLGNLLRLKILKLCYNNISKIENLDTLLKLQRLYLTGNAITKIENLDHFLKLELLILNENKISTIENLNHLKQLQLLRLSNNKISYTKT